MLAIENCYEEDPDAETDVQPEPTAADELILDDLGPEPALDAVVRSWYRDNAPNVRLGDDVAPALVSRALTAIDTESRTRAVSCGWSVAAMAVATHRTVTAAAAACGMGERTLRRLLSEKPEFVEMVELAHDTIIQDLAERHSKIRTRALARLERCLDSDDERIALRAAQLIAGGIGL